MYARSDAEEAAVNLSLRLETTFISADDLEDEGARVTSLRLIR
jgi:hypothetical protein